MKKILYFDAWTKGIRCFKPIDAVLKNQGIETSLVHLGSFTQPHPKAETIDGIKVRDISFYKTNVIFKVLEKEKPDAVLSLNTSHIWDRALILACRELKIPCFFAMHGDFLVDADLDALITSDAKRNSLLIKLPKLYKYLRYHFANYFYSYRKSTNRPYGYRKMIRVLMSGFRNPAKERYFPTLPIDTVYDKALIYSDYYAGHYRKVGYSEQNIVVTGYPEYDEVHERIESNSFSHANLPEPAQSLIKNDRKYVVYLDPAYADANFYGWTHEYRSKHLSEIAERLKKDGLHLLVKIHPSNTDVANINITSDNASVIKEGDLANICFYGEYCIVHSSTANNVPLLLNKALVFPRWGLSKGVPNRLPDSLVFEWLSVEDPIVLPNLAHSRKYVSEYLPRVDNKNAAEIIADHIVRNATETSP